MSLITKFKAWKEKRKLKKVRVYDDNPNQNQDQLDQVMDPVINDPTTVEEFASAQDQAQVNQSTITIDYEQNINPSQTEQFDINAYQAFSANDDRASQINQGQLQTNPEFNVNDFDQEFMQQTNENAPVVETNQSTEQIDQNQTGEIDHDDQLTIDQALNIEFNQDLIDEDFIMQNLVSQAEVSDDKLEASTDELLDSVDKQLDNQESEQQAPVKPITKKASTKKPAAKKAPVKKPTTKAKVKTQATTKKTPVKKPVAKKS